MRIAIDARYLGHGETGRLLESILTNLDFTKDEYVLIGKKEYIEHYMPAVYVYDNTDASELENMFKISKKTVNMCDAFFTPSFIIPRGIKCKIVSIMPNLMWIEHPEHIKSKIEAFLKKRALIRCLKKSSKVFTMSKYMKNVITSHYKSFGKKIIVKDPGVSLRLTDNFNNSKKKGYVIFTGNYKYFSGIEIMLEAMTKLTNLELLIVGRREKFKHDRPDLVRYIDYPNIRFSERITNSELLEAIQRAKFLVAPNTYSGFNMSVLEALNLGTKVIISDIPAYKEIFGKEPVDFFESGSVKSLCQTLVVADPTFELRPDFNEKFSSVNFKNRVYEELTR